jgi:hypothetical protein
MNHSTRILQILGVASALFFLTAQPAAAQRMSGEDAIDALKDGGYVLVMLHAPASLEAARATRGGGGGFGFGGGGQRGGAPAPEPTEEALETMSSAMLTGMRYAIWHFDIPIGAIYTSPTRRTVEHAEEIPFTDIEIVNDLGPDGADSGWLARKLMEPSMAGSNTIIVTHADNIRNDLGIRNVAFGETLIVRPGDEPTVVGRLGLREWSVLAIELDE